MARAPIAALFGFLLGTAFAGLAILLLGWVVMTNLNVARGFDWAVWVAQRVPDLIPMPPDHFGNRVINSKTWVGIFAVMAGMLAFNLLRGARRNLRSADESDDGEALLELVGPPPRVGRAFEGALVLAGEPQGGDLYLLSLRCYGPEDSLLYEERMEGRALPGAKGSRVPFRFDVPLAAPPTRARNFVNAPWTRRWELGFSKKESWSGSSVPLEVAPMDEADAARFAKLPKHIRQEIDSGRSKMPPGQEKYYAEWQLRMGRFIDAHGWKLFAGVFFGGLLAMLVVFILFKP